jgi:hypothetical protein
MANFCHFCYNKIVWLWQWQAWLLLLAMGKYHEGYNSAIVVLTMMMMVVVVEQNSKTEVMVAN